MKIAIITVAYNLADDLYTLYDSANGANVHWHVFLHSQYQDVMQACIDLQRRGNVSLYEYGFNRGLARSWNEGLLNAYTRGADVAMIANDDAWASMGDVDRLAAAAMSNRDKYMVSGMGYDLSTGERKDMLFSLCAINPVMLERVGMFDENFHPIYFEDIDLYRRTSLLGLERLCIPQTNIFHAGSKSRRSVDPTLFDANFSANRDYYIRKWGGDKSAECYATPFNDPALSPFISPRQRHAPYPGYDRTQEIVSA